ncbi:protein lin-9 homolog [Culicoides brevitarsis]|uniref:protein lin-9 homolog n=1 Tax=Culicoides brevitarsis TaxID=469753 RepID=UPI00307C7869
MSDSGKKSVGLRKSTRVPKVSKEVAEAKVNVENLKKTVKEERASDEESSEEEVSDQEDSDIEGEQSFGPAALGLHRVGTALPKRKKAAAPSQTLNRRGIPARIKKKNPLFYDDNMVNDQKQIKNSPKKPTPVKVTPKGKAKKVLAVKRAAVAEEESPAPVKKYKIVNKKRKDDSLENAIVIPVDKKLGQRIGLRLRNLLKLPKAHKFVSYEWFYSTIDKAILGGENDFQQCLRECYPTLVTRNLTRAEWNHVRRTLGKPRRCSQIFFDEERRELERRRQKIRLLQTRKVGDPSFVRDLPKEIPMPLTVGTKVTARLRAPQDGLFSGTVEAVDPLTNSYRVKFDRPGLASQSIPDYEVAATDPPKTLALSHITQNFRPRKDVQMYMISPMRKAGPLSSIYKNDPLLGGDSYPRLPKPKPVLQLPKDQINGRSIKLLEIIVRAKKLLSVKQSKFKELKKMNAEIEQSKAKNETLTEDLQKKYAYHVIGMEKLNRDITECLSKLQTYCNELTDDSKTLAMLAPSYMREKCREMAVNMVEKNNSDAVLQDEGMLDLITNLTTVMWITSHLNNNEQYGSIMSVLTSSLHESRSKLAPENGPIFDKNVEAHVQQIKVGIVKKLQELKEKRAQEDAARAIEAGA